MYTEDFLIFILLFIPVASFCLGMTLRFAIQPRSRPSPRQSATRRRCRRRKRRTLSSWSSANRCTH